MSDLKTKFVVKTIREAQNLIEELRADLERVTAERDRVWIASLRRMDDRNEVAIERDKLLAVIEEAHEFARVRKDSDCDWDCIFDTLDKAKEQ